MVYFKVDSADETAAKVEGLGGSSIQKPFDIMDVGRMTVLKDPGGAVFSIFQPNRHRGAGVINENHSVIWSELATCDTAQARDFYSQLLGWETRSNPNFATYVEFGAGGTYRGGLLPMEDNWKGIPSHWGIYFRVADVDAMVEKVKSLGGSVRTPGFNVSGVGRLAMLIDPQGASFSFIAPQAM